jgi:hypothetical protein
MTTARAYVDTETTSLRADRRAWEIAVVLDDPAVHGVVEKSWFVLLEDLDLGNADLMSLKIGRFFERHPEHSNRYPHGVRVGGEKHVLAEVEAMTRGAHIIGGVPGFDADVLGARMRARGICPSWHYHLIDFETLIVGYVRGRGEPVPELPWKSDDLSRLIGVEPPGDDERHTALGDARWARRVWEKVMG